MKILAFLSLLLFSSPAFSALVEHEAKSKLQRVKVFLNGAEMTRTTESIRMVQGMQFVILSDLSDKIDSEGLQASGTNGVRIVGTEVIANKTLVAAQDSMRLQQLNDTLLVIAKRRRELNYQLETVQTEKTLINSNNKLTTAETGLQVDQLAKLSDLYQTRLLAVNKKLFEINESLMELSETEKDYRKMIQKLKTSSTKPPIWQIKVQVFAPTATSSKLTLKYLVGGAAWTPKYDIRVEGVDKDIEIGYQAKVMNQTGEEWSDYELMLSTADPKRSQQPPSLQPWTLNYNNGRGITNQPQKLSRSQAQMQYGNIKILEGVEYEQIEVSPISVEFTVKERYTIPSDHKPYVVDVATYQMPATYKYYSIPKMDNDAFLLARFTGWERLNLIEGPTNLYFRGTFIGKANISTRNANDTLSLSVGRDNKVIVTRKKLQDNDSKQFLGNKVKETFTYKVRVRNTNSSAVKATIVDQVPVSQDSEIEVDILDITGAQHDELSGRLTWPVDLQPSETREFTISYVVKYPKNKSVVVTRNTRIQNQRARAKF